MGFGVMQHVFLLRQNQWDCGAKFWEKVEGARKEGVGGDWNPTTEGASSNRVWVIWTQHDPGKSLVQKSAGTRGEGGNEKHPKGRFLNEREGGGAKNQFLQNFVYHSTSGSGSRENGQEEKREK